MQATVIENSEAWETAFTALELPKDTAHIFAMASQCPVSAVREDAIARLCQRDPGTGFHAGVTMANVHTLSPACYDNLFLACVIATKGEP